MNTKRSPASLKSTWAARKLAEAMRTGVPAPLTTKDLVAAAKSGRPTTRDWFSTARNYALYSNEGDQYDDVLDYLKLKR